LIEVRIAPTRIVLRIMRQFLLSVSAKGRSCFRFRPQNNLVANACLEATGSSVTWFDINNIGTSP
jgi:hypothetical protein